MMPRINILVTLLLLFTISCSGEKKEPTVVSEYKDAHRIMKSGDYSFAAEKFEKVSDDYAFSSLASKAQMMAVYSYYKSDQYDKVQVVCGDFLNVFPADKNTDYVMYVKALSYYNQIPTSDRAQGDARKSSSILREIVARFPDSKYTKDARLKINEIDRNIAGSYTSKGRYFMNNEQYIAAINNFQKVVGRYRHTNQICEAHFRLVEIFYKLGIDSEAMQHAKKLKSGCKNSQWFKRSEELIKKI